jgi:hypothetical protein
MSKINQPKNAVDAEVDRLFKADPPVPGKACTNPVTGAHYIGKLDPTATQKRDARAALLAREHFALHGPAGAPPLPVSHIERESLKTGGLPPPHRLVCQVVGGSRLRQGTPLVRRLRLWRDGIGRAGRQLVSVHQGR